ncbi:MAG: sulfur carrier protein ThiS adenylyltransferase ThiF [Sedimentisphaeraceae bacterium JB056]
MEKIKEDFINNSRRNFGDDTYEAFNRSSVAVAGLGGLGSCVAASLARAAVGKLVIVDFDIVEMSNMNRQQYFLDQIGMNKTDALTDNLRRINPCLEIESHCLRLTPDNIVDILGQCDVVCECFDLPDQKQMLVETVLTKLPDKPIVAASGMAAFGKSNDITTRHINDNFHLVGDGVSAIGGGVGLYAARVGIAANHQANMVLSILDKKTKSAE